VCGVWGVCGVWCVGCVCVCVCGKTCAVETLNLVIVSNL
jgi:hypothetical protein